MKQKLPIIIAVVIILTLAITSYYFINKNVSNNNDNKNKDNDVKDETKEEEVKDEDINIIETRPLTTVEQTFFSEYLIENPAFVINSYNSVADLSIPKIVMSAFQGIENTKILTIEQKRNIIKANFKDDPSYNDLYNNPDSAFNFILDGKLMRELFTNKTGETYDNPDSTSFWTYNETYDVYYNDYLSSYGIEQGIPNYYTFSDVVITNDNYEITYISYYQPTTDSPEYDSTNPTKKIKLFSGTVTLKKISEVHYHFISNILD